MIDLAKAINSKLCKMQESGIKAFSCQLDLDDVSYMIAVDMDDKDGKLFNSMQIQRIIKPINK